MLIPLPRTVISSSQSLQRYHGSGSNSGSGSALRPEPRRPSRSPPVFWSNTPVKEEEGVLVMDDVLVKSPPVSTVKSLPLCPTDSGASASASASSSLPSSSSGMNYKRDLYLSYIENSGYCRYGNKCQFAHGNRELRPTLNTYKSVLETPCKRYNSSGTSSSVSKSRDLPHETSTTTSPTMATPNTQTVSPASSIVNLKSTDWSPLDDGITAPTSSGDTPSKEDVEAEINRILYGPRRTKRLPVFKKICPE